MHVRDAVKTLQPYRPGMTLQDLKRFGQTTCVKLGSNENPLGPAPAVREALVRSIDSVRLYPDPGAPRLREALAARYRRSVEETIAGAGIDDLLDLTVRCMLDPGDTLVLAHPGFVRYAVAARLAGGEATLVPGREESPYAHDLDGMLAAVDARTRIVVLVNPNNPTGSMFTRAELEAFLDRVPARVLTVLDEAYFEFVDDPAYPDGLDYLRSDKPLLVFRTFSKIHSLAGIRVGFGFGPPDLIELLDRARLPFNVSIAAQEAALAALDQEAHVRKSADLARSETRFLADALAARGWTVEPTRTNFVFAVSPGPGAPLVEGLLARGFILRPLTGFGLGERFFRISHGTRPQNEAFIAALDAFTNESRAR
jgi:histidinol-phosphate aminotransferase